MNLLDQGLFAVATRRAPRAVTGAIATTPGTKWLWGGLAAAALIGVGVVVAKRKKPGESFWESFQVQAKPEASGSADPSTWHAPKPKAPEPEPPPAAYAVQRYSSAEARKAGVAPKLVQRGGPPEAPKAEKVTKKAVSSTMERAAAIAAKTPSAQAAEIKRREQVIGHALLTAANLRERGYPVLAERLEAEAPTLWTRSDPARVIEVFLDSAAQGDLEKRMAERYVPPPTLMRNMAAKGGWKYQKVSPTANYGQEMYRDPSYGPRPSYGGK